MAERLDGSAFALNSTRNKRDEEDGQRLERFSKAWNVYMNGPEKPLTVESDETDDNIPVPYEQVLVNKSRSYLFGKDELDFELEEAASETAGVTKIGNPGSSAMDWLAVVWKRNKKMTLLLKLATNGGVFGHCFLKIVPRMLRAEQIPRLVVLDPMQVRVDTSPFDVEEVVKYTIFWEGEAEDGRAEKREQVMELVEGAPDAENSDYAEENTQATAQPQTETPAKTPPKAPPPKAPAPKAPTDGEKAAVKPAESSVPPQGRPQAVAGFDPEKSWLIIDRKLGADDSDWIVLNQVEWPFSWAPIMDCQNLPVPNQFWGLSDIEQGIQDMNMALTRLLSNLNRIVRFHAHPHLYTKGITPEQLETVTSGDDLILDVDVDTEQEYKRKTTKGLDLAPDSLLMLPSPDAEIDSLEMMTNLDSSIELYKRLKELYHEVTRIPEIASGKMENAGNVSGVALQILYGPLLELTEDKHRTYGELLSELNSRLLELGGFGEGVEVRTVWPDVMPSDPQSEGAVLLQDQTLGASEETLLRKRGYDPEFERGRRHEEAAENMEIQMQRVEKGLAVPFGAEAKGEGKDARQVQKQQVNDQEKAEAGSTKPTRSVGRGK